MAFIIPFTRPVTHIRPNSEAARRRCHPSPCQDDGNVLSYNRNARRTTQTFLSTANSDYRSAEGLDGDLRGLSSWNADMFASLRLHVARSAAQGMAEPSHMLSGEMVVENLLKALKNDRRWGAELVLRFASERNVIRDWTPERFLETFEKEALYRPLLDVEAFEIGSGSDAVSMVEGGMVAESNTPQTEVTVRVWTTGNLKSIYTFCLSLNDRRQWMIDSVLVS